MSEHQFGDVFENENFKNHIYTAHLISEIEQFSNTNKQYISDRDELILFLDEISNDIYSPDNKRKYT